MLCRAEAAAAPDKTLSRRSHTHTHALTHTRSAVAATAKAAKETNDDIHLKFIVKLIKPVNTITRPTSSAAVRLRECACVCAEIEKTHAHYIYVCVCLMLATHGS